MKIYNISEIPEGLRVPSYEEVLLSGYTDGYEDGYNTYPCYKKMYLTIEATGDGSISVSKNLEYSINGGPWVSVASGGSINVSSGDKTRFKGINAGNGTFVWTGVRSIVYGNIMSIMYGDEYIGKTSIPSGQSFESCFGSTNITDASNLVLPATTVPKKGYCRMFAGCGNLVTAPELPALVFEGQECYAGMFQGCQSLVNAPALPAETLSLACYDSMFWGCTSLTTAPELPATTLAGACYDSMFRGCTSITVAPALPATELDYGCYNNMFYGCTSLVEAPELPSTTLHGNCYAGMFERCTSLVEAPELPATDLNNIPGMMLQYNYKNMFRGCTSLVTAPELPALHLSNACYKDMFAGCTSLVNAPVLNAEFILPNSYDGMFSGCTSLEYVECMAKSHSANDTTYTGNWMDGVPANGVFKCDCEYNWSRDSSGIPAGWTVIDNCPHPENEYMTFDIISGGSIMWSKNDGAQTNILNYQINDGEWQSLTPTTGGSSFQVSAGDVVKFKGEFVGDPNPNKRHYNTFSGSTAVFEASGNVMSLVWGDNFVGKTSFQSGNQIRIYSSLFQDLTGLTSIENLVLPATTLSNACYTGMFAGCTAITKAPVLPAETLTISCYRWMFSGCTALNEVTCLATSITATQATQDWLDGVSQTGIFYNECGPDWSRDASGVPSGWTMHTECAPDYSNMYFTVEALADGQFTIPVLVSWRLNGGEWVEGVQSGDITVNVVTGDKIEMSSNQVAQAGHFRGRTMTDFKAYGNIMSMVWGDDFTGRTGFNECTFALFFEGKTSLKSVENLVLPETTLVERAYRGMFSGCTSIEYGPVLPATTLAKQAYQNMFRGCTSLVESPDLPASVVPETCYSGMFRGCTNLTRVKCLATDISATDSTYLWMRDVPGNGTFVKNANMTGWSTGANGIPSGWTVEDA